jgi:hypothetical protein
MCTQCNAGHFSARPGPAKRVLKLFKSARPIAAIRTGLSLLRARCTAKSRVKAMQKWSERLVHDASSVRAASPGDAQPPHAANAPSTPAQSLFAVATAGLYKEIRPDVFHALVQRYCRKAESAHLYALHTALRQGGAGLHSPHENPWASDAVGMDKHVFSTAVGVELARRSAFGRLADMPRPGSGGTPIPRDAGDAAGNASATIDRDAGRGTISTASTASTWSTGSARSVSVTSRQSVDSIASTATTPRTPSSARSSSSDSFDNIDDFGSIESVRSIDGFRSSESFHSAESFHSIESFHSMESFESFASIESIGSLASLASAASTVASAGPDGDGAALGSDAMESLEAALAKAFVRFAAGLQGLGDYETASIWLQKAVERLSDAQLGALGAVRACLAHGQDGAGREPSVVDGAVTSNHLDRFIDELHLEVMACAKSRLDGLVRDVRRDVDVWLKKELLPRGAANWARERLSEALRVRRYETIATDFAHARLFPQLLVRVLASATGPDVDAFVRHLDVDTLAQLQTGIAYLGQSDEGRAQLAENPRFAHAVHEECQLRPASLPAILDVRRQAVRAGLAAGDRHAAARALRDLAMQIKPYLNVDPTLQAVLPEDAFRALREAVSQTLTALIRDPSNPAGPLDAASLSRLSNEEIEMLRQSEDLAPLGLCLSSAALGTIWKERSKPHRELAVAHAKALLDELARPDADARDAMRVLYDCAQAASRAWHMQVQIQAAGQDDRVEIAKSVMADAIRQLEGARGASLGGEGAYAAGRMAWSADALLSIAFSINEQFEGDDLDSERNPAYRIGASMRAAALLATALAVQLDDLRAQRQAAASGADDAAGHVLSHAWTASFRAAIAELFGVVCDSDCQEGRIAMDMKQYEIFEQCLADPIPLKRIVPVIIDANTDPDTGAVAGQRVVNVDMQFVRDAIERTSARFSVSGVDHEGRPVAYRTSDPAPSEDTHVPGIKRGLLALHRLAGPDTAQLSNYMTQIPGAGFLRALMECGSRSPIKLDDGRVVIPGGGGETRVDVIRHADGSYLLATRVTIDEMRTCTVFDEDGTAEGLKLDPARSYASVSYETRLRFLPDGVQTIEMTAPVTLQYRLVPVSR